MEPDAKAREQQIQFARHAFDNLQALIRSSDTKAGVMVTIMVFFAASALQVVKDTKLVSQPCVSLLVGIVFVSSGVTLFAIVLWSFAIVHKVVRPRGARYTAPVKGSDLLWQEHVLLHENNAEYFDGVSSASADLILRNLTDQVYELAHISKEKMAALAYSRWVGWLGFVSWALLVGSGLILGRH
jgi:hypothetical protein